MSQNMEDDSEWTSNIQTDMYYRHTELEASKTTEHDYMYRDITELTTERIRVR